MQKSFTVELKQDPNSEDLLLDLPQEIVNQLQLKEGDTLQWNESGNGGFILSKK